jgi:metal-dependent hydrolase (beta-lactamase superfamily II)
MCVAAAVLYLKGRFSETIRFSEKMRNKEVERVMGGHCTGHFPEVGIESSQQLFSYPLHCAYTG